MRFGHLSQFSALFAIIGASLPVQGASAAPGRWTVEKEAAPLTNLPILRAQLVSDNLLVNIIGVEENARLMIRCSEGIVAVYVIWPDVFSHDLENVWGDPKTMVMWKLDGGTIKNSFWAISSDGIAAGEFSTGSAAKLIARWHGARQLVVRMSGRTSQDAVFSLDGVDEVAKQVFATCGATKQ